MNVDNRKAKIHLEFTIDATSNHNFIRFMMFSYRILLFLATVFLMLTTAAAKSLPPAIIINDTENRTLYLSYISEVFLVNEHANVEPKSAHAIKINDDSIIPITVFMMTNRFIGLSVAVLPGDTIHVIYNPQEDTYEFKGQHPAELTLYKEFGESKFSARNMSSPVQYSNKRPIEDYIKDWRVLWNESEQRISKVTTVSGIRPQIREHFVLEARLRLLQILLQPIYIRTQDETLRPIPQSYQDTVFAYEQKAGLTGNNRSSPSIAFAHRGHACVLAERAGKRSILPMQYEVAKREYTGYQREWTCYSVLKDMFVYNNNVELLSALLKDYQSWTPPTSPFVKKLLELTKDNDLALLSDASLNDELMTSDAKPAKLFDIVQRHKGQVVYVDFWASWCKPCIGEMPASLTLRDAYRGQKLAVVYVSIDADQDRWVRAATTFLANTSESYRLPDEKQSALVKRLQIKSIPRYLLIDKNGVLRYSNAPPPSATSLRKLVDSLL
jgi:thiol-disulfide isomerase/thioredoxin